MAAAPEVLNISLAARQYVQAGWALVPIESGTKGPNTPGWQLRKNCVTTSEQCSRIRANVGLAHAYSGTCVLDLDDVDLARAWLAEHDIDLSDLWDAPDAVRISSGRPNRGKLLFRLPEGVQPLITRQLPEHGLELRCASGSGNTVQDVLPPSIHPDTRRPYEWEYDELLSHWSAPPELPQNLMRLWTSLRRPELAKTDEKAPLGLGKSEMRKLLAQFDPNCGYQEWIGAGFALHHEMRGSQVGFEVWDEWSATGGNYPGEYALQRHWESFGQNYTGPLITARSLMTKANIADVDDFDVIDEPPVPAQAGTKDALPKFAIQAAGDFAAGPPLTWIIKKILPRAALGVVFGESGAGKSFVTLDMLMAIARGVEWRGHRVTPGRVVMVVAEGVSGATGRFAAYARHHDIDLADLPIGVIKDVPDLTKVDYKHIAKQVADWGGADVIVFDTLSQSVAGANENSAEDMGLAIKNCKKLHEQTGALVLLVHHAGKDATRGARGWSGIKAAADVEIEVSRALKQRSMRVSKSKDGADGAEMAFSLNTIVLGQDNDGDDITSCVVEHNDQPVQRGAIGLRGHALTMFNTIVGMLDLDSELTYTSAIEACVNQLPHDPNKRDRRRDLASQAFQALESKDLIRSESGKVYLQ